MNIAEARLWNQRLMGSPFDDPASAVRWLGAVQAQDYLGAKWALALRGRDLRNDDIDAAFDAGHFLRTHVMRPTWHFVAPEDLRWLLALTGPRVHQVNRHMYRQLELDDAVFRRTSRRLVRALEGGRSLTRSELAEALERDGIVARGTRLAYILMHAELSALVCSGPLRGKQHTYALLEERIAPAPELPREEAFATLVRRYFTSHGPATAHDFSWWSGLKVSETRRVLTMVSEDLDNVQVDGETYWFAEWEVPDASEEPIIQLLPNYDEQVVAYRDRRHIIDPAAADALSERGDGPLAVHLIARNGQVIGGWRHSTGRTRQVIEVDLLVKLERAEEAALTSAGRRYGRFVGVPVEVARDAA